MTIPFNIQVNVYGSRTRAPGNSGREARGGGYFKWEIADFKMYGRGFI